MCLGLPLGPDGAGEQATVQSRLVRELVPKCSSDANDLAGHSTSSKRSCSERKPVWLLLPLVNQRHWEWDQDRKTVDRVSRAGHNWNESVRTLHAAPNALTDNPCECSRRFFLSAMMMMMIMTTMMMMIIDNFYRALFSGVHKLSALYNKKVRGKKTQKQQSRTRTAC